MPILTRGDILLLQAGAFNANINTISSGIGLLSTLAILAAIVGVTIFLTKQHDKKIEYIENNYVKKDDLKKLENDILKIEVHLNSHIRELFDLVNSMKNDLNNKFTQLIVEIHKDKNKENQYDRKKKSRAKTNKYI